MAAPEDRVKYEQLYYAYRDFMFRTAMGILRNPTDAEDAVQDAFESVARNLSAITELDSPRTRSYLAIITERKAIDRYRDRKKFASTELAEDALGTAAPPDAGGSGLSRCIAALPPRYREMILLKYSHGYTIQEAAAILEITPAAAAKLLQRARERLYGLCRDEGLL